MNLLIVKNQKYFEWAILSTVSILSTFILNVIHVPASFLLGPMIGSIIFSLKKTKTTIKINNYLFSLSQGFLGLLIAKSLKSSVLPEIYSHYIPFFLGVLVIIFTSTFIGFLLTKMKLLPGTTAIWGSSPGAAYAMTILGEAYGADVRLVAVMQYLRVICATIIASVIEFFINRKTSYQNKIVYHNTFYHLDYLVLFENILLTFFLVMVAKSLKSSSGSLLFPIIIGAILQNFNIVNIELPYWLLFTCYVIIGWSIGLKFDRDIIVKSLNFLPKILISTLTLIGVCGLFSVILVKFYKIDILTAYLAMSPGGSDSIAIIAESAPVDMPFVMAMQILRFIIVIITAPIISKYLSKKMSL
ncbi:membrane protein [Neokomagataea thailandica NBRC 106555]|uniref:AbrB family transcriptional regulator n=2 Tax=Neokomagataea TaxID=1223423 RepID=A0A4Y6VC71_9PROT|nr:MULTISPECIES: AbrB family transcriptional regulator [Neokomagataea]QDH26057.1 AbrB family transcriptional regulator [Neokomagataea tanensis]GBR55173.1 membrane protein [Neokomagataea thailandica NBRC 106555]